MSNGFDQNFSKTDTLKMKGIAIIFLICFHCFSSEGRLSGFDVSFYPFTKEFAIYISETMFICVGIFIFLSSYGMTISSKKLNPSFILTRQQILYDSSRRYIRLMSGFLIIFVPSLFISFFFFYDTIRYGDSYSLMLGNMLLDMLGVGHLYGIPKLNGSWWYMSFAICLIFIMPVILQLYRKYGVLVLTFFFIIPFYVFEGFTIMEQWLFAIPLGIIFADRDILVKLKNYNIVKKNWINKFLKIIFLNLILFIFVSVRNSAWGSLDTVRYILNGIIPAFVIYYSYELLFKIPILDKILLLLGKHSLNIFLIHTFIRWNWFNELTYSFNYWLLIIIFLLGSSTIISILIEFIKNKINYNDKVDKLQKMILPYLIR